MRALACSFIVLLAACGENDSWKGSLDIPDELAEFRETARACGQDARWTYFERSEHCVIVAETMFDYLRDDCDGMRTYECANWQHIHSDSIGIYQRAILESLSTHGTSPEMERVAQETWWQMIYFNGVAMRALFEECLEAERRDLEQVGFITAHEIMDRPLAEGQRCYRKGYPEFDAKSV